MKRGPYKTFAPRLLFPLIGIPIAALAWWGVLASNDMSELEVPAILALSLSTAAFALGGIAIFIFALVERAAMVQKIIHQDDMLAVLCDDPALREMYDIKVFARDLIGLNPHSQNILLLNSHFGRNKEKRRVDIKDVPFTFVRIQRDKVKWEWRGMKKLVHGMQKGTNCTMQIQPTWEGSGKLAGHEIGHVVCSYGLGMWNIDQHPLMKESGIETAAYMSGMFMQGGLPEAEA